jgi:hypothetical protein
VGKLMLYGLLSMTLLGCVSRPDYVAMKANSEDRLLSLLKERADLTEKQIRLYVREVETTSVMTNYYKAGLYADVTGLKLLDMLNELDEEAVKDLELDHAKSVAERHRIFYKIFLKGREDAQTVLARIMEEEKGHIREAQAKAAKDNRWKTALAAGLQGLGQGMNQINANTARPQGQ